MKKLTVSIEEFATAIGWLYDEVNNVLTTDDNLTTLIATREPDDPQRGWLIYVDGNHVGTVESRHMKKLYFCDNWKTWLESLRGRQWM